MATKESKKSSESKGQSAEQRADSAANALNAKISGPLAPLEKQLDQYFGEKAPVKIPKNGREAIVKYSPWISLAAGLLGLFATVTFWNVAHQSTPYLDAINRLATATGQDTTVKLGLAFWISLVMLGVFSVLALLSVPGLKARKKAGWNIAFVSALANFVYGIVALFYDGGGVGSLLSALIGTIIALFVLFQVRSYYKA